MSPSVEGEERGSLHPTRVFVHAQQPCFIARRLVLKYTDSSRILQACPPLRFRLVRRVSAVPVFVLFIAEQVVSWCGTGRANAHLEGGVELLLDVGLRQVGPVQQLDLGGQLHEELR